MLSNEKNSIISNRSVFVANRCENKMKWNVCESERKMIFIYEIVCDDKMEQQQEQETEIDRDSCVRHL